MADSGAAGSSGGDGNSYFGDLSGRFAARYGSWRSETHSPQTRQEYQQSRESNQTNTCTRLAVLHYQAEMGRSLDRVTAIDSHMFRCKWVDAEDPRLCFHLNFSAYLDGVKRFFFAEIIGTNSPQLVTACVLLGGSTAFSVRKCQFCTGIWHPMAGGFRGSR